MAKGWPGVVDRSAGESLGDKLANPTEKKRRPFAFLCPRPNCYLAVAAKSREHAEEIERTHTCPHVGGITHIGSTVTLTLLESCWEDADSIYEKLVEDETLNDQQREALKNQLNGMCRMIARFMPPIMHTAREVGDEIRKRKNMRDAHETYETPGLGNRRYESVNAQRAKEGRAPVTTPAVRAAKVLTEQERKAIKFAAASGMFTVADLAKTYDVTEAVIREVSS
jgi:hypothetical protein